jgi:hypothetical protein
VFHDDIAMRASVAARAFDLVDEFRWRFDCTALSFRERIAGSPVPYIASLVILGVDFAGDFLLYATRDLWASDVLIHAQIDAGGRLLEAASCPGRGCRWRRGSSHRLSSCSGSAQQPTRSGTGCCRPLSSAHVVRARLALPTGRGGPGALG